MFKVSLSPRKPRASCGWRPAAGLALVLGLFASRAGAQSGCPGTASAFGGPQFPTYTNKIANSGVVAGDKYVYFLSYYGFARVNISNPDVPSSPELANVGHDPSTGGSPPYYKDGGPVFVSQCDCHGNGGATMAAAEDPATGNSRLISDWEPAIALGSGALSYQAATTERGFLFGQQVNAQPPVTTGVPMAAIYLPGANKFFGYFPTGSGYVQTVDLTTTTGLAGQTGSGFGSTCDSACAAKGLQPLAQQLPWVTGSGYGLWAGAAAVGGQTKYFLVGTGGGLIRVASIDPSSGIPTQIGSTPYTNVPEEIAIATVKGGAFLFSAEGAFSAGNGGLQVYEIRNGNFGTVTVVRVTQPPAFQVSVTRVVVKASSPSSPAPLIFAHRNSGGSFIDIYDTNWLTPGNSSPAQQPRLGGSIPHLGNYISGSIVAAASFGAKVVQSGSVVNAYVFEALGTSPQPSIAVTKKDVSCISADPTAPPVANFLMTNLTAQAQNRVGTNYYGDRWTMLDTTSTGVPLTGLEWDLIAPDTLTGIGQIQPDASASFPGPGTVPSSVSTLTSIIWPCDPALAGDPASGSSCFASLGSSTSGASNPHNIKNRATNANPPSSISAATRTVQKPTVYVNGFADPVPTINVLTGQGVLSALGSPATQGNTADAAFNWTFTPSGSFNVPVVNPVPSDATAFSLSVMYKDGYVAPTVAGLINQTDLVAAFSLQSNSVLVGPNGQLTLVNQMQIAGSAGVDSVTYSISGPVALSGSLSSSFYLPNGTASITSPSVLGSYMIALTYTYHGLAGSNKTQTPPAQPFSTVNFAAAPTIGIFYDAYALQALNNCGFGGCNLVAGTSYYLADGEQVPNGVTYPGGNFYFFNGTTDTFQAAQSTAGLTVPFTPTAVCLSGCYVHVLVGAVDSSHLPVSVASSTQPLSASVNGPTSGSPGVPVTFSASVTGGVPPYSYQWACQYAGSFTSYVAGGSTFPCTYLSASTYQVVVRVTDSANNAAPSSPFSVIIGGGGGGGGQLSASVSGPNPPNGSVGVPVNFTANVSGGTPPYSYQWACQYAGSFTSYVAGGSTFSCTYLSASTYQVVVRVTDNASNAAQSSPFSVIITPLGPPAPSAAYTVQNAKVNPFNGTYDADAGQVITFNALEIPANVAANGYAWSFPDGSTGHGQQGTFTFAGAGAKQVTLTVTGDGANRAGTASAVINFNVVVPSFQALLVPAAEHFFPDPSDSHKVSATDVSVSNPGTTPVTISPMFLGFSATIPNNVFDLSTVAFDPSKKVTIPPKGTWSQVDVVKYLGGDGPNKGTLVFKYEDGDATPLATCRVYVAPFTDPLGPSAGTAFPPLKATRDGQVLPQGAPLPLEQSLPGLRGDASYDFRMSLFNSVGISGMFRISAVDQDGNTVTTLKDPRPGGGIGSYVDFGIGPYQAVDWSSDDLGLNDPTKRYVLKASKTPGFTTGQLLPLVTMRDRVTRDQVIVTSDGPPEYREPCAGNQNCVNYSVAGASRYPTPDGGRWKTSISIYNPSTQRRGLLLTYSYTTTDLLAPEKVASSWIEIPPNHLATVPGLNGVVCCDDVVSQLFATQDNHLGDLLNGTFGVLRVQHYVDGETSTSPLLISARNYDDQPTGTYGSQLAVYTLPILVGPGETPLFLAGLQQDDSSNPKPRFAPTYVDVFAYDDVLTVVRLTALKKDGTELGHHIVALNNPGASGHFQRRSLGANDFTGNLNGIQNEPISVKIEVLQGGRVGAYALIQDITTRDPTYVQASP